MNHFPLVPGQGQISIEFRRETIRPTNAEDPL
jgi:hypothetical protein